jgi:hypothetical protein
MIYSPAPGVRLAPHCGHFNAIGFPPGIWLIGYLQKMGNGKA